MSCLLCVYKFHTCFVDTLEDGVFDDIPSDPEIENDIFEESSIPIMHEYSITQPPSSER